MSIITIPNLPAIASGNDSMLFGVDDSGVTKKLTGTQLFEYVADEMASVSTQTSLADNMTMFLRNVSSGADEKTTLNVLKAFLDGEIGDVKHVHEDFPNAPAQPAWWAAMDGSLISDADSPFNGYRLPNDNGADVVLTVTWASGVATIPATDVTALAVGDRVAGSGIAAGAVIDDITGTTVTMSDTSFSGSSVSTTFNNPGRFWRAAETSGPGKNDAMQRITGVAKFGSHFSGLNGNLAKTVNGVFSLNNSGSGSYNGVPSSGSYGARGITFNSADSISPNPAKTNDEETHPVYRQYVGYMKIKNVP